MQLVGRNSLLDEEAFYSQDLAISRYAGKWKLAKCRIAEQMQMHARKLEFPLGIEYWLAVRMMYLELGGMYKD